MSSPLPPPREPTEAELDALHRMIAVFIIHHRNKTLAAQQAAERRENGPGTGHAATSGKR